MWSQSPKKTGYRQILANNACFFQNTGKIFRFLHFIMSKKGVIINS